VLRRLSERTQASKPTTAPCLAIGCRTTIPMEAQFCDRHAALLQDDIKRLLGKHYRPGKKQSAVFQRYLEMARQELLEAQHLGHRVPKPAEFEW